MQSRFVMSLLHIKTVLSPKTTMQTEQKSPKYCDQCGDTLHTDEVALAACRRLLKLDDLNWLLEDLQLCWEYFREHLPEYALSVGAQERYNEYKMDSETPSTRCVSMFLKAAAFTSPALPYIYFF